MTSNGIILCLPGDCQEAAGKAQVLPAYCSDVLVGLAKRIASQMLEPTTKGWIGVIKHSVAGEQGAARSRGPHSSGHRR